MNYFLGLDAGGTKTRAVIIDENSKLLATEIGGPANYHNIGMEQMTKNVYRAIAGVLSKSFLDLTKITWCTIGAASCDTKRDYELMFRAFSEGDLASLKDKLTVVNDTKIGLYSGAIPPAIVVIAGTGSNVYGKNAHGESATAGNWGHFLGDKGSGYQLAKRMFGAVIAAYDETGDTTSLTTKVGERIGAISSEAILDWYNETQPSIREVSDFVPIIIDAAEEGDEVAKALVDQTVSELGRALTAVLKKLKMENEAARVVIMGGLFESKYFRAVFEGHVTALVKHVRIISPLVDASVGAAIMAREKWKQNSQKTEIKSEGLQMGKGKFISKM